MRIVGIERDKTACNFYRVLSPLSQLDSKGMAEVIMLQENELGSDKAVNACMWADLLVFQRPATEAWFKFIKLCRRNGKLIVSDYDDDPFNTSPLNPYYQYIGIEEYAIQWPDGTKEMLWSEGMVSPDGSKIFNIERNINHRDMFHLNFKKSDMVTCTTETLRESFLKINPNVTVLPNLIDFSFFPQVPQINKREVRIGWQGGCSHYEDLYMIKNVLARILDKHSNAKLVFFGDMRFKSLFNKCNPSQVEWHPWVSHSAYPYKLALLNLDIGLCPLVDNVFNRNKSAIKWMEYSAMKYATVASDIPPYKGVLEHDRTALLVPESEDAWFDAIDELVRDKYKRVRLAQNAYDCVHSLHNMENHTHLWHDAYDKLMKGNLVTA